MLRRIEPEKTICYNTPFPEMQGNMIHVDYKRSSWRYMNYERSFHREDLDAFKIGGTSSNNRDTIEPYLIGKAEEAPTAEKSNRQNQRMSDSGESRAKQNIPIQQKESLLKR